MLILSYNFIEPVLVAILMGSAIQIAQLGTAIYLLITMVGLTPFILTENPSTI
jgi:hypothetical protein